MTQTVLGRLADTSGKLNPVADWFDPLPLEALRQQAAGFATSEPFTSRSGLFERLAETGSQARVAIIACSDLACDLEGVLGADPGSLFTIRNAGNIVPRFDARRVAECGETAAAIDVALAQLPIEHLIVCGHSGCATLGAMLDPDCQGSYREQFRSTADALSRTTTDAAERAAWAAQHHVLVQLHHLSTHPAVARGLAERRLQLHGWYFDTAAGELFTARSLAFTDDVCAQFEPL